MKRSVRPPRTMSAVTGALFGALIWLGLSALGVPDAVKIDFRLGAIFVPIGASIGITRIRAILPATCVFIVVMVALAILTPIGVLLDTPLIRNDSLPAAAPDAIAVLSGGVNRDGSLGAFTLDRLLAGIEISRRYPGVPLLISRAQLNKSNKHVSDSLDVQRILFLTGVKSGVFYADSTTTTRDEATRMRRLARGHFWERIIVVTSPLHTRRACATFEAVGFTVTCVAAIARSGPGSVGNATRNMESFRGWVYETAGMLKYRYAGWIRTDKTIHSKWRRE